MKCLLKSGINKNWMCTIWLSGGALDCPVRHATAHFQRPLYGGWGYKYPNHPTFIVSAFRDRGSLDRRVNCRRVPQPRWVGARRSAKGGRQPEGDGRERWKSRGLRVCPAPRSGALAVGGYKRSTREGASGLTRAPVPSFPARPTLC
jgi:hypothetical protein